MHALLKKENRKSVLALSFFVPALLLAPWWYFWEAIFKSVPMIHVQGIDCSRWTDLICLPILSIVLAGLITSERIKKYLPTSRGWAKWWSIIGFSVGLVASSIAMAVSLHKTGTVGSSPIVPGLIVPALYIFIAFWVGGKMNADTVYFVFILAAISTIGAGIPGGFLSSLIAFAYLIALAVVYRALDATWNVLAKLLGKSVDKLP